MHHQENTKTSKTPQNFPCGGEAMLYQEHIITQQHNNSTWTTQSANTCQQCHVDLCHELSQPHHYYGPVEAPKIGSTTRGIPARSGPWLAAPYLFGIAGPTGDNGTSFPI